VGTETLSWGTVEVDVNAIVAVSVCVEANIGVGDKGGGSGVNVGSNKSGDAVTDKAVCTNPAITVCAAEVLMVPGSCSVMVGKAQAGTTIDKMMIVKETRPERNIAPPNQLQVNPFSSTLQQEFVRFKILSQHV